MKQEQTKREKFIENGWNSRIAIFGTGFLAAVFTLALREAGLSENIEAYVVTKKKEEGSFLGRPVLTPAEYKNRTEHRKLYLAVHESLLPEVTETLAGNGLAGEWIGPVLYDLLYGEPLEEDTELPVDGILEKQDRRFFWLAARYGALRALEGEAGPGREIYIRLLSLFSSPETAKKRLAFFAETAEAIRRGGFDPSKPVLLDENGRIIDGLHRIVLAKATGEKTLHCRIYRASGLYDRVLGERNFITEKMTEEAGLTKEERRALERYQDDLFEKTDPVISVILPVYNVAGYIDQCMETLLAQTFTGFEALLIDDGSADGSSAICDRWGQKDRRIRVFHKENGGVSSARNLGIERARGTYLAFADPDDWLDPAYLEKLLAAAEKENADIAECDLWRVDGRTGKKIHRSCGGNTGVPWTREEHMIYGPTASYKAISKRSLWIGNGVRFPDCAFESPAVYALLIALAEKTVNIPEPLYYYRRFRPESLIETGYAKKDGSPNNTLGTEAMAHLVGEFERLGLKKRYRETLERVVKYRLSDILATQFYRKTPADYRETVNNFRAFLSGEYPGPGNETYITFGGYNLNRILVHMKRLHDPYCRFNFISLISAACEDATGRKTVHKNAYRRIMLAREEEARIFEIIRTVRPSFLFLDLTEERFDVLKRGDRFLTASDAREGAVFEPEEGPGSERTEGPAEEEKRIPRGSAECRKLFEEQSGIFFRRLREAAPGIRIVVIENYLCEEKGFGDEREPFENAQEIRKKNEELQFGYQTVRNICPDAVFVSPREIPACEELLFTDKKYEYGAVPEHLNEIANRLIAAETEKAIEA